MKTIRIRLRHSKKHEWAIWLGSLVLLLGVFVNDCYGFINWRKIRQRQDEN